ncbi:occludin/ELL domain-containing protein 1 isoform X1 [Phalacrocorax aristotelis]|uniref:occludin/ELL domain-containing protein 1 isoform X1 n=1 Tax=Phalacrocorax aristotelis TaxID=126867 RepID=UPI003F4C3A46
MRHGDPQHPQATGSRWPSPPAPPGSRGSQPPPHRPLPPGRSTSSHSHLPLPHGAALPGQQPPVPPDLEACSGPRESRHHWERGQPHAVSPPLPPSMVWWPRSLTPTPRVLKPPLARAKRVTFEDEVMPSGRPLRRDPPTADGEKLVAGSVHPGLAPWPRAVPDYVVKYPAIRSPRQREGYKGVFQDQLAEYTELLGDVRATRRRLGELEAAMGRLPRHATSRTDSAFLGKQQRCEYLKEKLTHIKARIQEYDRDAHDSAVF